MNPYHVRSLKRFSLTLTNGTVLPVPEKKYTAFKKMLNRWAEKAVPVSKAKNMTAEELEGKVVYGEFVNTDSRTEYTVKYDEIIRKAKGE